MLCGLALALVAACAAQDPAIGSVKQLTLELRIFNGAEEVTSQTRATLHRAGERGSPLLQASSADGRLSINLSEGLYDVQVMHERDGRVLDIRWANRLVLMPYPDEAGQHLEVVNFKNGFGALQIREPAGGRPVVALYEPGKRDKPVASPFTAPTYLLFVVRAGVYDLLAQRDGTASWHQGVDVPLDRTRLWVTP